MTLASDKKLWLKANKAYHAGPGQEIMTDDEFNALEDRIREADPNWGPLHETGVIDAQKEDVDLPNFMPSLAKQYPHEIDSWIVKRTPVGTSNTAALIMDKLDGSAIQVGYKKGKRSFLATRGNGEVGGDISFLLPFLKIPETIPEKNTVFLRCEAVMQEKTFRRKYSVEALGEKLGKKTARAAVAGLLNSGGTKIDAERLADIDIIVLGIYDNPLRTGLDLAARWGFCTVFYEKRWLQSIGAEFMGKFLTYRLNETKYAIDGLVLAEDRVFAYEENKRPEWATAYKRNVAVADAPETPIKNIQWDVSHAGKWTPTAQYAPLMIGGTEFKQASVYSAEWMVERCISPGAVVKVVRGGDVIPKVVDVVKPAKEIQWPPGKWEWRGAHIYATQVGPMQRVKIIERFFEVLKVEEIALKSIIKMYDYGYNRIHLVVELLSRPESHVVREFTKMGVGPAKGKQLYAQRDKVLKASLKSLALASCSFEGIGDSRLDMIEDAGIPLTSLLECTEDNRPDLTKIHGFKDKTQAAVFAGVDKWQKFWPTIERFISLPIEQKITGEWSGMSACWTGYRNKDEEAKFIAGGGKVVSSVTKNTTYLFCKPGGETSTKGLKAKSLGVTITQWNKFTQAN